MTPQDHWVLQKENALAWLRVVFAVVALAVVQLNPSRFTTFPVLSGISLVFFLLYSAGILYWVRQKPSASRSIGTTATWLDVIWISVIVFLTGGTRTPFFTYYTFPVITASSRWGMKGSLIVALVGDTLYWIVRYTLTAESLEGPLGMDTFLVRSVYLIVLAYIFGFLSEFEKKQNEKLLALSKTASEVATLVERRRVAQDLHDGLLQSLATHILRLETCRKQLLGSPGELDRELHSIEDDTRTVMTGIRQFLAGKAPQSFLSGTLFEKLKQDLRFLQEGLGLDVILETVPEDFEFTEEVEKDIYYVLREALMNIARHAHASHVNLTLKQTETAITGSLRDNGIGFDPARGGNGPGLGLSSMKERMKRIGGELELKSSPGKGTTISFVLPVAVRAAA